MRATSSTAYEYDALGRLTAVVENATTTGLSDYQTNVRTTYTYDLLGNMTAVENALGHTTVYTYDDLGRRTAEADALGHVTAYVYDGHGRRLAAGYPDAGGPFTVTARLTTRSAGRKKSSTPVWMRRAGIHRQLQL
jgi:YD repeat-containing protein